MSDKKSPGPALADGSRVGVIGGGPAGSFFSYFCLDMASRIGLDIGLDLYEPRDFSLPAPHGCNMCGGVVSESLVQTLAAEGINLPPDVVQRGIESYMLHMDVGNVRIASPTQEKRIAAVHRGLGPRSIKQVKWGSFDAFLQNLAADKGTNLIRECVKQVNWIEGRPQLSTRNDSSEVYDLLVVAVGINGTAQKLLQLPELNYHSPLTARTVIFEYYLGEEKVNKIIGDSMHVFLLNLPRLEFAAIIPKGDYVTVCMLGEIDNELVESFLNSAEVKECLPADLRSSRSPCLCKPRINVQGVARPFADRLIFIGDCGVTRLYKDGIGAAFRTGKAAAATAVLQGISAENFQQYYWPVCQSISRDNSYGKFTFAFTRGIQKWRFARQALLNMVTREQRGELKRRNLSRAMWDIFTGSAPYKEILLNLINPVQLIRLVWNLTIAITRPRTNRQ